jgi:hypothetical protein
MKKNGSFETKLNDLLSKAHGHVKLHKQKKVIIIPLLIGYFVISHEVVYPNDNFFSGSLVEVSKLSSHESNCLKGS